MTVFSLNREYSLQLLTLKIFPMRQICNSTTPPPDHAPVLHLSSCNPPAFPFLRKGVKLQSENFSNTRCIYYMFFFFFFFLFSNDNYHYILPTPFIQKATGGDAQLLKCRVVA